MKWQLEKEKYQDHLYVESEKNNANEPIYKTETDRGKKTYS